ncbi:hypothetical protein EDD73_1524 [Heliophilum fasciatum]|uniref:SdpI/YhfL family protein n=1 Tax=Heliophilum fasciatum TaxID=35700 RepID=A0A4R2R9Z0_9FIRM|nr:hypothetical protein EDD73_1524 [Heliophilum fasciatum]
MDLASYLLNSLFILLGIVTILIGEYIPEKKIMPKRAKYKIIDFKNYIKACRKIFYWIGIYYVLLGFLLLLKKDWITFYGIFELLMPSLIGLFLSPTWRKYTEPLE